ncbi:hypothetical protein BCR34DRAFT_586697 [Clohesyomyces aquaticus]|uniref:F-box domain-containing protein n=1 Tax=Clohesyomyces aquaticus TaxID=1231657 RepID=A0A1Y1ZSD2_9PLEO|nr:hypothetical protein BCR34DRAFT_586697 [Clohesyomyces aquaticus]
MNPTIHATSEGPDRNRPPVSTSIALSSSHCSLNGKPPFTVSTTYKNTGTRPIWALIRLFKEHAAGIVLRDPLRQHWIGRVHLPPTSYGDHDGEDDSDSKDTELVRLNPADTFSTSYTFSVLRKVDGILGSDMEKLSKGGQYEVRLDERMWKWMFEEIMPPLSRVKRRHILETLPMTRWDVDCVAHFTAVESVELVSKPDVLGFFRHAHWRTNNLAYLEYFPEAMAASDHWKIPAKRPKIELSATRGYTLETIGLPTRRSRTTSLNVSRPAQTSLFPSLPPELLDNIFMSIGLFELFALSQTCVALRAAALPVVLRDITMVWTADGEDYSPTKTCKYPGSTRLDLLLRTILEAPKLAEFIVTVDFRAAGFQDSSVFLHPHASVPSSYPYGLNKPTLPSNSSQNSQIFLEALKHLDVPFDDETEAAFVENDLGAIIALFLLVCPNLTTVTLGLDLVHSSPYISHILLSALSRPGPPILLRLIRLNLGIDPQEDKAHIADRWKYLRRCLDIRTYLSFFYLPTLEEAELACLPAPEEVVQGAWHEEFTWPISFPAHAPALKKLCLPNSRASPTILNRILSATSNLTTLEYSYFFNQYERIHAGQLSAALDHVKHTLIHLKLNYDAFATDPLPDFSGPWVLEYCSLKSLAYLQTLEIPLSLLLGWWPDKIPELTEVLPDGLIELWLGDDERRCDRWGYKAKNILTGFMLRIGREEWRDWVPELKILGIVLVEAERLYQVEFTHLDWIPAHREECFRLACDEGGRLECGVRRWQLET